MNNASPLT